MDIVKKEILGVPVWVYLCAFVPRLLLLAAAAGNLPYCVTLDSKGYLELAAGLSAGVFALPGADGGLLTETLRTPGYPLFLAALGFLPGSLVLNAAIAQTLLGGLTVLFAWKWFEKIAGRRGAVAGALFFSLDYVSIMHTPLLLAEVLLMAFVVPAAAFGWKAVEDGSLRAAGGSGFLWALASFVKPVTLYLPLLLAPLLWRRKRHMFFFLLLAYSIPFAWSLRNYARTGYFTYSTIGGVVLLRYSAGRVEALRTGKDFQETSGALVAAADGDYPSDAARSAAYSARALEILKAHPFLTVRYLLRDLFSTVGGTGAEMLPQALGLPGPQEGAAGGVGSGTRALLRAYPALWPLQIGYLLFLAAVYFLFARGVRALKLSGRRGALAFLLICTLYLFAMASTNGYYRYRIPPMLFLAAGAALAFSGADRKKEA